MLIFWGMAAATYFFSPQFIFFEPTEIPYTPLDKIIPSWSWTIVIYFSLYVQVSVMFFVVDEASVLWRFFIAYMIAGAILTVFYLFLPTTHNFPPPVDRPVYFFDEIVLWLRNFDIAANQLPSGHATYSMIGPFFLLALGRKRWGQLFFLWGFAICVSTLMVKQHNIIDVLVGILFAFILGYWWLGSKAFKSLKRLGPKPL